MVANNLCAGAMMLQWVWKQKYRIDRGYQMISLINLILLLVQSERLADKLGMSVTSVVLFGLPFIVFAVWVVGWIISHPKVQCAEDRAVAEVSPSRRDLGEVLRILKKLEKKGN